MRCPHLEVGWLGLVAGVLWAGCAAAQSPTPAPPAGSTANPPRRVPLEELPAAIREPVRRIVEQPTLSATGPAEEFTGRPAMYQWLLDHPNYASQAWRRLGTPCLEIADRGNGQFGWTDGEGSDLFWKTVYRTPAMQIWYAEGRARTGLLLPTISMRAVVVLHHQSHIDPVGRSRIRHQADIFVQTDSKAAALLARFLGPSVPRLAEQGVTQMQLFFSALTWYLERHPDRAEILLFGGRPLGMLVPSEKE
jgi:hypothetical protein